MSTLHTLLKNAKLNVTELSGDNAIVRGDVSVVIEHASEEKFKIRFPNHAQPLAVVAEDRVLEMIERFAFKDKAPRPKPATKTGKRKR